MNALSDLGIPRDIRHISGFGVHTYRFINDAGNSILFKWSWKPVLGHRSVVYDEALKLAGENANFQRVDLYNNIAAGIFPEWEFQVQLFPDDGTYMWHGMDLLDATVIIPIEMNPPISLGKITLNRNPTNYFAEPESISFAPSNVVKGVSFVPDPLLQWRLMSYDDTATHRHNSPNGYLLPINRAIAPINNNYRDGYMQPLLFEGASASSPDNLGGEVPASPNMSLPYTGIPPETVKGPIGRFPNMGSSFDQARTFWDTLDPYAQQHLVDAYRFELGHVTVASVQQRYIDKVLNPIDNCLARRVAMGIGAMLPAIGSGPMSNSSATSKIPSLYPLTGTVEPNKSNAGLTIGIIADGTRLPATDLAIIGPLLSSQQVSYEVVGPYIGKLQSGVSANQSYVTTSSVFYDAIIIGSALQKNMDSSITNFTASNNSSLTYNAQQFIQEAYGHGKAIAILGSDGVEILNGMGIQGDTSMGILAQQGTSTIVKDVLSALSGPVRFPQRFPVDSPTICQ